MSTRHFQWFGQHRNLAMILALVVIALVWLYLKESGRSGQTGAMAVLECSNLYAGATTAAETTVVDAVHPIQGLTAETTCLMLREAGQLSR